MLRHPNVMKVLILSVTAGEGHNSAAKAICRDLSACGAEVEVLDTLHYLFPPLGFFYNKIYLLGTFRLKRVYARGYAKSEKRRGNSYTSSPMRRLVRLGVGRLARKITSSGADVVVCVHPFTGFLVDAVQKKYALPIRSVGILTDFTVHPYWEEALRLDRFVIAHEALLPAARKKGFTEGQLLPFGIPTHPKFAAEADKKQTRLSLGLDPGMATVLLTGGSMGCGNLTDLLAEVNECSFPLQILLVCGNNRRARRRAEKAAARLKKDHRVTVYGFVGNMDELMSAADCIITKPGGLSTGEALVKRLPLILCHPIPGQEDRNAVFLANAGAALFCRHSSAAPSPVKDALERFFSDPALRASLVSGGENVRKPNAAADICAEILSLGKQKET